MKDYRVVIIGAGPAGIGVALRICDVDRCHVTMVDRGPDLPQRVAAREGEMKLPDAIPVNLEGFGGAGAFSDGKLTLTSAVGGHLDEIVGLSRAEELISRTDDIWLQSGAPTEVFGTDQKVVEGFRRRATVLGMKLVTMPVRHMGTDRCTQVLSDMRDRLQGRCEFRFMTRADNMRVEDGRVTGVELSDGAVLPADFVVAAPGRSGLPWFEQQAQRLQIESQPSPVDLGVRLEVPAVILSDLTDRLYEFKLLYWSPTFDNQVRTFCVCPYGEVVTERIGDVITVNGHSYAEGTTQNTNFAILVSSSFTKPFDDPVAYGQHIASLANLLGDGVLIQRLTDLKAGRRTTDSRLSKCITTPTLMSAAPGDLSYVLPYRHLKPILEMIETLDELAPGIDGPSTLLYGVEVKLYSQRILVSEKLETGIENLFACGDGAGITRGLMQASASGLAVGDEIAARIGD